MRNNVASAGVLVKWTAVYGDSKEVPPKVLGAPHWSNEDADFTFEEPPKSIDTSGTGGTRTVIEGVGNDPETILRLVNADDGMRITRLHARWDEPDN